VMTGASTPSMRFWTAAGFMFCETVGVGCGRAEL